MLLRPGGLPVEAIARGARRRRSRAATSLGITAPGQLASHYAPRARPAPRRGRARARRGLARLRAGAGAAGLNLSPAGDLAEAAANLFAHLRAADALAAETGAERIAVAPIPREGLGLALNDRLARAAAPRT